ncbi:MAG TPA: glycosyltransferase family 4 protein [Polyangia bacterium]|nr:glycosyltransferase family 4 protein [Polyangia bacterium]
MIRKRLAIFSPGGIGHGPFSQGQPAIGSLVASLAERFEVTYYSLAPVDRGFAAPAGYRLRAPHAAVDAINVKGLRWGEMARRFLADHLVARYDRMLSFWGYPMGTFVVGLGRTCRVPVAVLLLGAETADVPGIGYGQLGRPFSRRMVIETCRRTDALVAVAEAQLEALARRGFSRPDDHVVPIGAEADLFPFEVKRRAPLRLLNVGNLTAVKDQATLLRAFALLPRALEARLRIVGSGSLRGELDALRHELRIADAVELTGAVPFTSMLDHYRWANVFVLTSLSEGQNRSLTEAAMCGVLQVSTPVGHIADLGETVAVVVRAGDPRHVADRIVGIAADAEGWSRRVRAARGWAASHDMSWTVDRLSGILEGLRAS